MPTEIFDLIPENIKLSVVPIRRTVRFTTEEGVNVVKRNQIALRIDFEGEYKNTFTPHNGYSSAQGIVFMAITPHKLVLINNIRTSFTLPDRIYRQFSAFAEK